MIFTETPLPGAYVIEPERIEDPRGFFARAWAVSDLAERGLETAIAQCSLSWNEHLGTLRGMHFQRPPHEEVKVVRCTRGALYDVIIDLRPDSATYCRWAAIELDEESRRMLYVPRGFAHGFQTLVDGTEAFYMVSEPYAPDSADGVRWDDPAFGVEWPLEAPSVISDRDRSWPDFVGPSGPQGDPAQQS
jgi:dTDP-4-dehydrorhamnose 3,5-epimerase